MSFEHKYLKYKQKYLELKKEVSLLRSQLNRPVQNGGAPSDSDTFNVTALTDTPKLEQAAQLGGFLMSSESDDIRENVFRNSESENSLDNIDNLTETPMKKHDMIISVDSSEESAPKKENEDSSEEKEEKDSDEEDSEEDDVDDIINVSSDDDIDQEGGDLETSISELEEIFSQLGGKKKSNKKKDDDDSELDSSSMSSLSSLDSSSSDFDL